LRHLNENNRHGNRSLCVALAIHLLCDGDPDPVSRRHRIPLDADRHLSEIDIPVVTVIWQYTGLDTPEMEQRATTYSQYAISTSVNGIKDIEAQTLNGIRSRGSIFSRTCVSTLRSPKSSRRPITSVLLPAGIQAPLVVQYNASSVPVLQISLISDTLSEQQLYDYGYYNLGQRLAPIHGVTFPTPAGGIPSPGMARTLARNAQLLDLARLIPVERRLSAGGSRIRTSSPGLREAVVPSRATWIPGHWASPSRQSRPSTGR
jgi:hypothetical protein